MLYLTKKGTIGQYKITDKSVQLLNSNCIGIGVLHSSPYDILIKMLLQMHSDNHYVDLSCLLKKPLDNSKEAIESEFSKLRHQLTCEDPEEAQEHAKAYNINLYGFVALVKPHLHLKQVGPPRLIADLQAVSTLTDNMQIENPAKAWLNGVNVGETNQLILLKSRELSSFIRNGKK